MTVVGTMARTQAGPAGWGVGRDPIVQPAAWADSAASAGRGRAGRDWRAAASAAVLVVPLVLVNGFATFGQGLWAHANLVTGAPWWVRVVVAVLFALALESIAVYLAAEAHTALMAGDAALGRRLASYGVAAVVGALNWLHWSGPGGSPTVAAVVFAGFSAISPWLWALRSRTLRRDQLRELGLVDARLPRFSMARWLLFPVRTFRVWRHAAWEGITDPAAAISAYVPPVDRQPAEADAPAQDRPAPTPVEVSVVEPPAAPVEAARPASAAPVRAVGGPRARTGRTPVDDETLAGLLQPLVEQGFGRDKAYAALTGAGHAVSKDRIAKALDTIRGS